jgi:hypothetical protein
MPQQLLDRDKINTRSQLWVAQARRKACGLNKTTGGQRLPAPSGDAAGSGSRSGAERPHDWVIIVNPGRAAAPPSSHEEDQGGHLAKPSISSNSGRHAEDPIPQATSAFNLK